MFEVNEGKVQLTSINIRDEKHGDEEKLACDLDFLWKTGNGDLALFAPDLRHAMYKRSDDAQGELDPNPEHLTALRFPAMAPFKWGAGDLIGASLTFHVGVKTLIKIEDVKVHKYSIDCQEGGSVFVKFQVQCHPDEQQMGKLSRFLTDKHVQITLLPPEAPEDLATAGKPSRKKKDVPLSTVQ